MTLTHTKHNVLSDTDIKKNHIISEKTRSVKMQRYGVSNNTKDKHHAKNIPPAGINHVDDDGLASRNVCNKTNIAIKDSIQELESFSGPEGSLVNVFKLPVSHNSSPEQSQHEDKSKMISSPKNINQKVLNTLDVMKNALKKGLISKVVYNKTKEKLDDVSKKIEPPDTEEPSSQDTAESHSTPTVQDKTDDFPESKTQQEPEIKKESSISPKHHIDKIEKHLKEMNETLKPGLISKTIDDKAVIIEEKTNSKEVEELRKKEKTFSDDIKALDMIYKDGIITLESYEEKKRYIEKKISGIEESIMRILEKEELDDLRERMENEIRANLTSGPFSIEQKRYREDIDALAKIYDAGLITNQEYLKKKDELSIKLNKADEIILKIDEIFEGYKKELIENIAEKKAEIERPSVIDQDSSSQYIDTVLDIPHSLSVEVKPEGILGGIKSIFGLVDKNMVLVRDPLIDKIKMIKKRNGPRDAIIKCAFILKSLLERKMGIGREMTYNELIEELSKSRIEKETQKSLIVFFEKVSIIEYKNLKDEAELPSLLEEVERLIKLVERMRSVVAPVNSLAADNSLNEIIQPVPRSNPVTQANVSVDMPKSKSIDIIQHKSKSFLEKVNSFFGV
ncbi:MAG: hypothetical protein V1718_06175 [archaeon]